MGFFHIAVERLVEKSCVSSGNPLSSKDFEMEGSKLEAFAGMIPSACY